jgi:hypothetical protein
MVSELGDSESRPTVGARVVVLQEGDHKGKEGEITRDDKRRSSPYIIKLDDGTETRWLMTKEVAIGGGWRRSCVVHVCSLIVYVALAVLTVKGEALRVIRDAATAKARAADAATTAAQAAASAMASVDLLIAAGLWTKIGDSVSIGSDGKQQVWRDIAAADAASIEVGMRVKVDRKGGMVDSDIRSRDGSGGGGSDEKLEEGDEIEANYKGRGKYCPGNISRVRLNGTYDISYDDGEREMRKEASDIRSRDAGGGDGVSCKQATVVKADAGGGTWEVEYEEGGEKEGGVVIGRLKQRLVHEWAHSSYNNGTVQEEKEGDGSFVVALDGLVMVSELGDSESRPTVGARVVVLKEGDHKGKEGEITEDDEMSCPYIIKLDDGTEARWLSTEEVAIRGEWGKS